MQGPAGDQRRASLTFMRFSKEKRQNSAVKAVG